jgi:hypothetical protein
MLKQSPTKELNYFTDAKSINGVQNQMGVSTKRLKVFCALNQ